MRSILVALAVLLGEFIPKFDLVMGVIGGTLTGPLIFILPPLFYTKMLHLERKHDKRSLNRELSETNLNETDLLLKTTNYGTLQSPKHEPRVQAMETYLHKGWRILNSECLLSVIVITFGVVATLTSTFSNILDIKSLNQFWSPCIQNISLSYQLIAPK